MEKNYEKLYLEEKRKGLMLEMNLLQMRAKLIEAELIELGVKIDSKDKDSEA